MNPPCPRDSSGGPRNVRWVLYLECIHLRIRFLACGAQIFCEYMPTVEKALTADHFAMTSPSPEESLESQRQILQLRDTVAALRVRLEGAEAGRDEAVQAAVAVGADEIRLLRTTIATLRDDLQTLDAAKQAAVQAALAAGQNEAHQLQLTIQTLREQLERAQFEHADVLARQQQAQQAELKQLHETIAALRAALERKHGN